MKIYLGIEFGSTRIKSVLIDEQYHTVAESSYIWQDRLENGFWTYSLDEAVFGLQEVYRRLDHYYFEKNHVHITQINAIGISAMMHGYLAFDENMKLLVPFRTWRNTTTQEASKELSALFQFNIPQRWSVSHLYQAILNKEEHVKDIRFVTTLAGYFQYVLTGEKCIGIGDASGMFPVTEQAIYNPEYSEKFNVLLKNKKLPYTLEEILPEIKKAGDRSAFLTKQGAALLDPSGHLQAGAAVCPPEGDAGTGMVCTNSVEAGTGNVSAGTSVFAMAVLAKKFNHFYQAVDIVATPEGKPVAMIHCNTCTSDLNEWADLIRESCSLFGREVDTNELYTKLFLSSQNADPVCGDVMNINYFSGEPVTGLTNGRPVTYRNPAVKLKLANLMKAQLYSAVATLRIGMDILFQKEKVELKQMYGHGGFFKTPAVGQQIMADALKLPISVMKTAAEGGAWGMAVLAAYSEEETGETLSEYLNNRVFAKTEKMTLVPTAEGMKDFDQYLVNYRKSLDIERLLNME